MKEPMTAKGKHILIVEDDNLMRDELTHTFARNGYAVSAAKTGEEALVIAIDKKPDLIVLDVMLPRMDGLTMLQKLRQDEGGKAIPVLVLSNLDNDKTIAETIEAGGYDYLLKADWKLEDVFKKVEEKFGFV